MSRKPAPYEGGQWSIDSSALKINRSLDSESSDALLTRHKLIVDRFLPHAQRRIAEGCKPYVGIAAEYQQELSALVAQLGHVGYNRTYNLDGPLITVTPDTRRLSAQLAGVSFPGKAS